MGDTSAETSGGHHSGATSCSSGANRSSKYSTLSLENATLKTAPSLEKGLSSGEPTMAPRTPAEDWSQHIECPSCIDAARLHDGPTGVRPYPAAGAHGDVSADLGSSSQFDFFEAGNQDRARVASWEAVQSPRPLFEDSSKEMWYNYLTETVGTGLRVARVFSTSSFRFASDVTRATSALASRGIDATSNALTHGIDSVVAESELRNNVKLRILRSSDGLKDVVCRLTNRIDKVIDVVLQAANSSFSFSREVLRTFDNGLRTTLVATGFAGEYRGGKWRGLLEAAQSALDVITPITEVSPFALGKSLAALSLLQEVVRVPYPPEEFTLVDLTEGSNRQLLEKLAYCYRVALASYSPMVIRFFWPDLPGTLSNKDIFELLLGLEYSKTVVLRQEAALMHHPAFFIMVDDLRRIICLSIRGSSEVPDIITDLCCRVNKISKTHQGMEYCAKNVVTTAEPFMRELCASHPDYPVAIIGHSLGGGIAALVVHYWKDCPFIGRWSPNSTHSDGAPRIQGYSFASPCVVSVEKSAALSSLVTSVVYGKDIVSRASWGSAQYLNSILVHLCSTADAPLSFGVTRPRHCPTEEDINPTRPLVRLLERRVEPHSASTSTLTRLAGTDETTAANDFIELTPKHGATADHLQVPRTPDPVVSRSMSCCSGDQLIHGTTLRGPVRKFCRRASTGTCEILELLKVSRKTADVAESPTPPIPHNFPPLELLEVVHTRRLALDSAGRTTTTSRPRAYSAPQLQRAKVEVDLISSARRDADESTPFPVSTVATHCRRIGNERNPDVVGDGKLVMELQPRECNTLATENNSNAISATSGDANGKSADVLFNDSSDTSCSDTPAKFDGDRLTPPADVDRSTRLITLPRLLLLLENLSEGGETHRGTSSTASSSFLPTRPSFLRSFLSTTTSTPSCRRCREEPNARTRQLLELRENMRSFQSLRVKSDVLVPPGRCVMLVPVEHMDENFLETHQCIKTTPGGCIVIELSPDQVYEMASQMIVQVSAFKNHTPIALAEALGVSGLGGCAPEPLA